LGEAILSTVASVAKLNDATLRTVASVTSLAAATLQIGAPVARLDGATLQVDASVASFGVSVRRSDAATVQTNAPAARSHRLALQTDASVARFNAPPSGIDEEALFLSNTRGGGADGICMVPSHAAMTSSSAPITAYTGTLQASMRARLLDWYECACHALLVVRGGAAAIRACAAETGLREPTLRRWAFAATRHSREDMESLASWSDEAGHGLSVWHVVELARFSRPRRERMLGEMRSGLWPVAKLRALAKDQRDREPVS
jgi:hypothetical protein